MTRFALPRRWYDSFEVTPDIAETAGCYSHTVKAGRRIADQLPNFLPATPGGGPRFSNKAVQRSRNYIATSDGFVA